MKVLVSPTPEAAARLAAEHLARAAASAIAERGNFSVALSGGSTPKLMYQALRGLDIDWTHVHVYFSDERSVGPDSPDSNYLSAKTELLDHVGVPAGQVHRIQGERDPVQAAADYAALLPAQLDLVLLGMGDDGHTLSLFPGTEVVHEQTAWTKAYFLDQQHMYRLTLTAPVVNRASCVLFLVAGPKKAAPLREVLEGDYQPDTYPAQVIKPVSGELIWMVDEKAAADLKP